MTTVLSDLEVISPEQIGTASLNELRSAGITLMNQTQTFFERAEQSTEPWERPFWCRRLDLAMERLGHVLDELDARRQAAEQAVAS